MSSKPFKKLLEDSGDIPLSSLYSPMVNTAIAQLCSSYQIDTSNRSLVCGNELLDLVNKVVPPEQLDSVLNLPLRFEDVLPVVHAPDSILADSDVRGKRSRPFIALTMALVLLVAQLGYDYLLYHFCVANGRLPSWNELIVPIGIPLTIVWSYFGFLKAERQELIRTVLESEQAQKVLRSLDAYKKV